MSALARLKALRAGSVVDFFGDSSEPAPSKPTKGGFDGFVGAPDVLNRTSILLSKLGHVLMGLVERVRFYSREG